MESIAISGRFLLFALGAEKCALDGAVVAELLPMVQLDQPPGLPSLLAGFMRLGGQAVPVLDLAVLFGLADRAGEGAEARLDRHIVLLKPSEIEPQPLALIVDRALDIAPKTVLTRLKVESVGVLNGCVVAEIARGEEVFHLLDADRLLFLQERERLAALRIAEAARLDAWDEASRHAVPS